ncbi:hypothetical protein CUMW_058370 [Citrus unshiu]|nr:hypothetical protein CUMW_058370 [Citrus unshiu]
MFPLHSGDELFFKVSSNSHQQDKIPQDLISGHASEASSIITNDMGKSHRGQSFSMETDKIPSDNYNSNNSNYNNNKKLMHRDVERQRRQEMATLYASLRALLPLEFIKGKRSISDQMNEGVNYVKYLEKKIKELGVKRDELKRLSNLSISASQIETSDQNDTSPSNRFVVHQSLVGIEIAYSCGYLEQELPLSKVLEVLLDEGLCVVNCVSTRVDERLLHTIQAEVKDPSSFSLSDLQQKLTQVNTNDSQKKKMTHRDIEKLRRQEMSVLHASLRSLLPLEYIKGKRSMSDHMNEAVNYVKDLKNKINELSSRRDELQKELASSVSDSGSSSNNCTPSRVVIHSCLGGLVVMISSGCREQGFPVSRVLEVLIEQGLDVVNFNNFNGDELPS